MAPIMVALTSNVDAEASDSHSISFDILNTWEGLTLPKISINEAPTYEITGIERLSNFPKKNMIATPINIGTEIIMESNLYSNLCEFTAITAS